MLRSFGNRGFQLIQRGHEWNPDQRKAGVRSAGFSESERRPDLPVTAPTKISSLCWRPSGCGYFRLFCVILITLAAQSQYPALLPSRASAPQGCCRRSRRRHREDDSRRRKIAASYARFSSDLQDAKSIGDQQRPCSEAPRGTRTSSQRSFSFLTRRCPGRNSAAKASTGCSRLPKTGCSARFTFLT